MYKKGDSKEFIKKIQKALNLKEDGVFGELTEKAVIKFQKEHNLTPDGIVGESTLKALGIEKPTENKTESKLLKEGKLSIVEKYLKDNQYIKNPNWKPKYIFLHHTAGWNDPYNVVKDWNSTPIQIGTHYVIGGQSIKGNDNSKDGIVVKCIPNTGYGYHLGDVGSRDMHINSVGIELCCFGQLTKKNGKFYNYVNTEVHESQVIKLDKPFRGFEYFHSYSIKQIDAAIDLIKYYAEVYNIDLKKGLIEYMSKDPYTAFEFKESAWRGLDKGILSHSNVRRDKMDVYPHPYLIKKLKELIV